MEERAVGRVRSRFAAALKYVLVLAALGAVVAFWLEARSTEVATAKEMRPPVRVVKPIRGPVRRSYRVGGYIESASMVTVLPRIGGSLVELTVDVGDNIRNGQVIAHIDDEPYRLSLRQAEAAYLAAESTFERTKQLFAANAASRQTYDQAKGQYDATKSQYDLAKLNLTYTEIKAPVAGTVVRRHASVGSLVSSQVPIVTIADLDQLEVNAGIAERFYGAFAENPRAVEVVVSIPAIGDAQAEATIDSVAPFVSSETKSFEVVCSLTNPPPLARPGMYVDITFVLETREEALSVPNEAIVGGATIWYLEGERARKVRIYPELRTDSVTVVPEEFAGRDVLIEGQHFIEDGQRVLRIE